MTKGKPRASTTGGRLLVPGLCPGTHCLAGSACASQNSAEGKKARGRASKTARSRAEPGNEKNEESKGEPGASATGVWPFVIGHLVFVILSTFVISRGLPDAVAQGEDGLERTQGGDAVVLLLGVGQVGVGHQAGVLLERVVAARAVRPA